SKHFLIPRPRFLSWQGARHDCGTGPLCTMLYAGLHSATSSAGRASLKFFVMRSRSPVLCCRRTTLPPPSRPLPEQNGPATAGPIEGKSGEGLLIRDRGTALLAGGCLLALAACRRLLRAATCLRRRCLGLRRLARRRGGIAAAELIEHTATAGALLGRHAIENVDGTRAVARDQRKRQRGREERSRENRSRAGESIRRPARGHEAGTAADAKAAAFRTLQQDHAHQSHDDQKMNDDDDGLHEWFRTEDSVRCRRAPSLAAARYTHFVAFPSPAPRHMGRAGSGRNAVAPVRGCDRPRRCRENPRPS